jgi:hypothetical protein
MLSIAIHLPFAGEPLGNRTFRGGICRNTCTV